ncbi:MAG: hypothetical protein CVV06_05720 [Gammaproteobacteria bacterium HGW-Gammaproteobacteria-10]|nr:MAG: hypothetical protein CVV06_05720 [Gammaproteobacteria bacterium HGW-Gammaproteobacteria-10]
MGPHFPVRKPLNGASKLKLVGFREYHVIFIYKKTHKKTYLCINCILSNYKPNIIIVKITFF